MLKAKFLGTPQLTFGADVNDLPLTGRALALLAYLSVTGQPHSRSVLVDLLWSDQSEQQARNNLRYLLRDLKKEMGDYLIVDGQIVAFDQKLPYWIDVTVFISHLTSTVSHTVLEPEPTLLQSVLDLYTGEFLAGFHIQDALHFERWMLNQRRQLHDLLVYGIQLSAQQHLDRGEYEAGLALNQYLVTLEPWREEAHRQRMLLLAASGQRSAALMQYEICCQTLEEELDVPPMDETTSLYFQIKSGQWFIERKTLETHRNQRVAVRSFPQAPLFPSVVTPADGATTEQYAPPFQLDLGSMPGTDHFVGRRSELATLKKWIDDGNCQLAAILGISGQGKSALAAALVQTLLTERAKDVPGPADELAHIVWRSLALRPSCVEILQDWVHQLTRQPRKDLSTNFDQLVTTLFAALEEKRCLLVLDGVEAVLHDQVSDAEAYERLFHLFIKRRHRSCLLLTSRIRPVALTHLIQYTNLVGYLPLDGLTHEDSTALLATYGIDTTPSIHQQLYQHYAGHPQLLSQAAAHIHDLFHGEVNTFLEEEVYFLGDIGVTLAEQIAKCSPLELQILHTLGEAKRTLCHQEIRQKLPQQFFKQEYYQALHNLQRTYFIQREEGCFKLAPVLAAYLNERNRQTPL